MSDDFDRKDYDFSDFDFMEELQKLRGGNNVRYICVQSRAPTCRKSEAYQHGYQTNAYRWLAQCRDIDFKNCEILDGILIDWVSQDLEVFGRRLPYTKTEKQEMGKKLLDEIMDSIFNLKI